MKHLKLFIILLLFTPFLSHSQTRGNEWINYDQTYYKIKVNEDGIYRIPYQTLVNSGFPADEIDPRKIQIFYEGEEQYIYIQGENGSGIFDPNGYIEFYGKRNRGYIDTVLWDEPENCINPDYSLFSDTSVYFITYNNSFNNRRISNITNNDYSNWTSHLSPYCIKNIRVNYTGKYYGASSRCVYSEGEGYLDASEIKDESPVTKNIPTHSASSGPDAIIEIAAGGTPSEKFISSVPHHLKVDFLGSTRIDEIYYGYNFIRKTISIPASSIPNSISFVFSSNDTQSPTTNDNNRVSYIDITYSHNFNFENSNQFKFTLPPGAGLKDYLEISDFNTGSSIFLYDLNQNQRILCTADESNIKALVNNNGENRELVLSNQDGLKMVNSITPVTASAKFTNYTDIFPNPDYLIITHKSLLSGANDYKSYRNSTGYEAAVYDFAELTDQYMYGIAKHPYAIRHMIQELIDETGNAPSFLFLMGKAIYTAASRNNVDYHKANLVATLGYPPSDVLITAGMGGTQFEPLIPTGRIAVRNNQQITDYLNKVIAYESNPVEEWMKNILHFGGGATAQEQQSFANFLEDYEEIIEDTLYGGFVHTFLKNSSDPIQISTSDSVRHLLDKGASMLCFFGHASTSGFDQSIDFPENYNNQDKFPFILANSCYSGNIHLQYNESTSEDWVLIADRGAIGFLASVGQGLPSYLNEYTKNLYKNISYRNYGESLGVLQKQAIIDAQEGSIQNIRMETTCHEMTLHGDPAVKLNHADLPDLALKSADISFTPENISTVMDSFQLNLTIRNIGHSIQDSFLVHIERRFPDNSIESLDISMSGINYLDTLNLKLPVNAEKGPGLNSISVQLDFYNEIEELDELNNDQILNFLISSSNLFPIYPYEYAIYPDASVHLKASTGTPFISATDYLFQMDTTDLFNSSLGAPLFSGTVNSPGGVVEWVPPISLTENQVYFWRVAASHSNPDSIRWNESSFIYIPGEEGWSQANFYQFKNDKYEFINYDRPQQDFDFIETPKTLQIHNQGILWTQTYEDVFWSIDGAIGDGNGDVGCCYQHPAIIIAIINPVNLKGWISDREDFGHRNYPKCSTQSQAGSFFVFSTGNADSFNEEAMASMNDMIINHVPDGHYVLAYSWADGYFESWPEWLISTFEELGSTKVRTLPNDIPWIFFAKKGFPEDEITEEKIGDNATDEIDMYINLFSAFNYGTITSTPIGPANIWGSLHWQQESIDSPDYDSTFLEILSYDPASLTEIPVDTVFIPTYEIYNLNVDLPAENYPYLKLRLWTRDDTAKTPAQIDKWQIRYSGIPETAINPQAGFYINTDTLKQGEYLEFALATQNVSPYNMDSLLVKYWIQTSDNNIIDIGSKRLRPHPTGDIIMDTLSYNTIQLTGLNSIWIEYNPTNSSGEYDQAEHYHFNNIAQYFFYVEGDKENPLLDITFDGIHILDGDIVSAKPNILMSLKDENKYIALNDTSLFRVFLTDLNTGQEDRIFFRDSLGNDVLKWTPASLPENKFRIEYRPEFIKDGRYQLRVQATDASGNESGDFDYTISFEVITASSITNILNYPNPFSSSTRFVFELTGSVIPDEIRIEIYTVTGKLVKVIDQSELGPIRIGRNISEYVWNGTDMYGDQLANGVYFYRVKTKILNEDIDHRSNESDSYFKAGIGKMYLMR